MTITPTLLPGVLIVVPELHGDHRGSIVEVWRHERFQEAGIDHHFVQDNVSRSRRGILRGLHFQNPMGQAKLLTVLEGEIFDVAVDVRKGSPTFGRWVGATLSRDNRRQLLIPEGYAHGFQAVSDEATLFYKSTRPYRPEHEHVLAWNDPVVAVAWPGGPVTMSARDERGTRLEELLKRGALPDYETLTRD